MQSDLLDWFVKMRFSLFLYLNSHYCQYNERVELILIPNDIEFSLVKKKSWLKSYNPRGGCIFTLTAGCNQLTNLSLFTIKLSIKLQIYKKYFSPSSSVHFGLNRPYKKEIYLSPLAKISIYATLFIIVFSIEDFIKVQLLNKRANKQIKNKELYNRRRGGGGGGGAGEKME